MRVWTVSEAKAGTLTQCLGVAMPLDPDPDRHIVPAEKESLLRRGLLSPYRSARKPEPDVVVSCGHKAERPAMEIRAAYRGRPLAVHLQRPTRRGSAFDLVFVSRHDWLPADDGRPGFERMVGVPHRVERAALEAGRPAARARHAPEGGSVVTVLVGGPNAAYSYDAGTRSRLTEAIAGLAAAGHTLLVSTSRRSPPALLDTLRRLAGPRVAVWDRTGENPFLAFMAAADAFLITKDTVTMTCEAATTGRPVLILDLARQPGPALDKFEWFHGDMHRTLGLTRPFAGALERYAYEPLDETRRIAALVRRAAEARRRA